MNDQQLASFIIAAEEGSFSKAADRCFISVPSFSQRIKSLEQELEFNLFTRSAKGVSLTAAGQSFLSTARAIQKIYDEGLRHARSLAFQRIRIGHISEEPFPTFFPNMINYCAHRLPEAEVTFRFAPEDSWIEGVRDELSDLCFCTPPANQTEGFENLQFMHLFDDPILLCCAPDSPLATKRIAEPDDLQGATVYLEPSYIGHPQFKQILSLEENGAHIKEAPFSMELVMNVLMEGRGVIPIPRQYRSSCCPPLVPIPLKNASFEQGVVYRKDSSYIVLAFIGIVKEYFDKKPAVVPMQLSVAR